MRKTARRIRLMWWAVFYWTRHGRSLKKGQQKNASEYPAVPYYKKTWNKKELLF